ncbi:MAG: hypothetical protein CVU46_11355 [Chloroflexi bacterium HGW-Chloroflexi-8]|nr:MAG: hypothetical protein CVU46_11355 [Chloroflexi bacterium HGW-Chloroflexi-8]
MFSQKKIWGLFLFILLSMSLNGCNAKDQLPKGVFKTTWQLVVIGDSSLFGLAEAYGKQIEKDNDVIVEIKDYAMPVLRASTVLEVLQTGKSNNIRLATLSDDLKEAEFVVMFTNPLGSIDPENPLDFESCFGCDTPGACQPEVFTQYEADLKAIWEEVIKLRNGKATVLRATDIYNPLVSSWKTCNIFEACDICWLNMSNAARSAAESYQIPFLSRYDAFNGLNHEEDPVEKGFISDGEHTTKLAEDFTAQLMGEMGYAPTMLR